MIIDSYLPDSDFSYHREHVAVVYEVTWQILKLRLRQNLQGDYRKAVALARAYYAVADSSEEHILRAYRVLRWVSTIPLNSMLSKSTALKIADYKFEVLNESQQAGAPHWPDVFWDWNKERLKLRRLLRIEPNTFVDIYRNIRSKRQTSESQYFRSLFHEVLHE